MPRISGTYTAIVTPFVRFDRLEYVRVLRYDFPGFDGDASARATR